VPVLAGGRLYFGTYEAGVVDLGAVGDFLGLGDTSYLYALDAASGDRVWRIETEVGTTAPAIAEGTAYLVEGGGDGAGTLIAYGDD
jgi:outer membrane protein assembly factor BamB